MQITTFTVKGVDVELTYQNGQLAYVFDHNGDRYGNAVKLDGRSIRQIVEATFLLFVNVLETKEAVDALPHEQQSA